MKKALSLFLAVLMIFAAMSVSASAASVLPEDQYFAEEGAAATYEQAILSFDLNGGVMKNSVYVYNIETGKWSLEQNVSGTYVMVPQGNFAMTKNTTVVLPTVTAPAGYQFDGWYCYETGSTYAANAPYEITTVGQFTHFRAAYSPAEVEEDTMAKVFDILIKVFGAIIGIVMFAGDTSAGVELMQKVLGGIMG